MININDRNIDIFTSFNFIIDSKFKVVELLHQGNNSMIYKVISLSKPDEIFALKLFYCKRSKSPSYKRYLESLIKGEFYLYKNLESEYLLNVFELGYDTYLSSYYYTMEYLDNCKSIFNYCDNLLYDKTEDDIAISKKIDEIFPEIVYKIIMGITYLHSSDMIHYDISPKNILVYFKDKKSNIPEIKIINLTLAEYNKINVKKKYKKNHYVSPEIYAKKELVDYRSDYFSIGVTIIHSFKANLFRERINDLLVKKPISLSENLSSIKAYLIEFKNPKIIKLLTSFLRRDPSKRFQSGRDIIILLNKLFKKKYEISQFANDFSYEQKKRSFILRNNVIQKILSNYHNFIKYSNKLKKVENNLELQKYNLIIGETGSGVNRTIKELKNTFSFLIYNNLSINTSPNNNSFEEILDLLNKLLVKFNTKSKKINKEHLLLLKKIYHSKNNGEDISLLFPDILNQVNGFLENENLIIIFENISDYSKSSNDFIDYLKSNIAECNFFIITSASYKNKRQKEFLKNKIGSLNEPCTIELLPLELKDLGILRKHLFGSIINIPKNFDESVLKSTKGNFKKVISLYDTLYKNEIIYNSFGNNYYDNDHNFSKKKDNNKK